MALRHAILAALLDHESSGYALAKIFDAAVSDFWRASPQQIYLELGRLEERGLLLGREVDQRGRPNKRVFQVTPVGREELLAFSRQAAKPSTMRDDLMVKLHAAEAGDINVLIEQLRERAAQARSKAQLFEALLALLRGERSEAEFLTESERVGPYLTCLRGLLFEQENIVASDWAAALLQARRDGEPVPPVPRGLISRTAA